MHPQLPGTPKDREPYLRSLLSNAAVTRGPESWNAIYVVLGFALVIESTVIPMITPLGFPWNLVVYIVVAGITFRLFLFGERFQNKLIGWKMNYEKKAR